MYNGYNNKGKFLLFCSTIQFCMMGSAHEGFLLYTDPSFLDSNCGAHCNENPIYVFHFLGIARHQCQFPTSCVCGRFMYSQDGSTYLLRQNRQTGRGNIKIAHRHMNVKIETEATQFLFWKYLFQIFVIGSLQCG